MKLFIEILSVYGFPTLAAVAMGWFIWFVYNFTTKNIKENLSETHTTLIALLDRIRMLDNDLIRLNTKLQMIEEYQKKQKKSD